MQTQRAELLNQLDVRGWRVSSVEDNLEWWADEMWQLESVWSPVGSRAYITFLVDPQVTNGRDRGKGEDVWAVMASSTRPSNWRPAEGSFTLNLGPGWKKEMPSFFEHLAALRDAGETYEGHE